jgi:arginine decarboxylase-like protein
MLLQPFSSRPRCFRRVGSLHSGADGAARVDAWGWPYFAVNASGDISVRPYGTATMAHQEIDLMKIVKKVASDPKHSGGLGLQLPLIVRLPDLLKFKISYYIPICFSNGSNYFSFPSLSFSKSTTLIKNHDNVTHKR